MHPMQETDPTEWHLGLLLEDKPAAILTYSRGKWQLLPMRMRISAPHGLSTPSRASLRMISKVAEDESTKSGSIGQEWW